MLMFAVHLIQIEKFKCWKQENNFTSFKQIALIFCHSFAVDASFRLRVYLRGLAHVPSD